MEWVLKHSHTEEGEQHESSTAFPSPRFCTLTESQSGKLWTILQQLNSVTSEGVREGPGIPPKEALSTTLEPLTVSRPYI